MRLVEIGRERDPRQLRRSGKSAPSPGETVEANEERARVSGTDTYHVCEVRWIPVQEEVDLSPGKSYRLNLRHPALQAPRK